MEPACTLGCWVIFHMTGGRHRTDCPAYEAELPFEDRCVACAPETGSSPEDVVLLLLAVSSERALVERFIHTLCTKHRARFDVARTELEAPTL